MKSIRKTLYFGLGMLILCFVVQLSSLWWGRQTIGEKSLSVVNQNTAALIQINELALTVQQLQSHEKEFFIYIDNSNIKKRKDYARQWNLDADKVLELIKTIKTNTDHRLFSSDELQQVQSWQNAANDYITQMRKIIDAVDSGQQASSNSSFVRIYSPAEANQQIGEARDKFSALIINGASAMSTDKANAIMKLSDQTESRIENLLLILGATAGLGILLALFLLKVIPKLVIPPIQVLLQKMEELVYGKPDTKTSEANTVLEFEELSAAVEKVSIAQQMMLSRLHQLQPKEK